MANSPENKISGSELDIAAENSVTWKFLVTHHEFNA